MAQELENNAEKPDPAAVFACSLSLWHACHKSVAEDPHLVLAEICNGMDGLMREIMRVSSLFEVWSCKHVEFEQLTDVWPYFLEEKFGEVCLFVTSPMDLRGFDESDCLRVALHLRLPIKIDESLRLPVDVLVLNSVVGAGFGAFRIRTARDFIEGDCTRPFTWDDDPFDEEFGVPYFCLYGVDEDGVHEHIADRRTYTEAVALLLKLAVGVQFSDIIIFSAPPPSPLALAR
jgi:hypothetical protein